MKQKNKKKQIFKHVTLGASLLGNFLLGKGVVRAGSGNKKRKEIVRAGTERDWDF